MTFVQTKIIQEQLGGGGGCMPTKREGKRKWEEKEKRKEKKK